MGTSLFRVALIAVPLARGTPIVAQIHDHGAAAPVAVAHRAGGVAVDGVLQDSVWLAAGPATGFRQSDPAEGAPATQQTEVRFAYDDEALYVGARMYDSLGSRGVRRRLMRRDAEAEGGDYLLLTFDTFHDHVGRTLLRVNPAGVKYDAGQATSTADVSWDPVWTYATRIDSLGWTAEIRIPLAQLRFRNQPDQTWGLQLTRYVERLNETSHWAFWTKRQAGGPSRFGHLTGLRLGRRPRGYELLPYAMARASYVEPTQPGSPFQDARRHDARVGADFRALLGSSLTLSATVNPDFGQVEVDPAVVNLSVFETRFAEKRAFFVEGSGQFSFGRFTCRWCSNIEIMSLFYSRRIGRRPQGQLSGQRQYTEMPENTDILAAGKLTGRLPGGLQVAVLDAVTRPEYGRALLNDGTLVRRETEPLTNYFVARVRKTMRGGNLVVGGIASSAVRRFGWDSLSTQLASHAGALGFDWELYWKSRTYLWVGNLALSAVFGDSSAIARLQTSSARYYQRPDRGSRSAGFFTDSYDRSLTSLRGFGGYMRVAKDAGDWRWEAIANYRSPGFETNDVAFLTRADYAWMAGNVWRTWTRPTPWYRSTHLTIGGQQQYNFDGDLTDRQFHVAAGLEWSNFWTSGAYVSHRPGAYDDRLTRGGPLVRRPASWHIGFDGATDPRKGLQLTANAAYGVAADGTHTWDGAATLRLRPASNVALTLGPSFVRGGSRVQFVTRFDDPSATHFYGQRALFSALTQRTLAITTRLNWTFSPAVSLELFAQPFIASGEYSRFAEFTRPRGVETVPVDPARWVVVRDSNGRDQKYVYVLNPQDPGSRRITVNNPDFKTRSLRGNAVLRWEYGPGSTLFVVWQQQRSVVTQNAVFDLWRDAPAVFDDRPDNVFVVKATYWLGR